ncbi:hypothetical protein D3C76_1242140 [compost metagenome]
MGLEKEPLDLDAGRFIKNQMMKPLGSEVFAHRAMVESRRPIDSFVEDRPAQQGVPLDLIPIPQNLIQRYTSCISIAVRYSDSRGLSKSRSGCEQSSALSEFARGDRPTERPIRIMLLEAAIDAGAH